MVDELAHAGPEHLDPGFVAGYDRKQGFPDPAGDLVVLREHGIGPASMVVDFGAGTGQFALAAAAEVSRVVAVDSRPQCRPRCRSGPPVRAVERRMRAGWLPVL